jgi:hypothetical protein
MATKVNEGAFRIRINGYWTALDFATLMRSLEDIYNLTAILSSRNFYRYELAYRMFPIDRRTIRRLALEVVHNPPLMVPQFRYASPGFADLLGAGKALKQLKEFLFGVTDRILESKGRGLDNEAKRLANEKAEAELNRFKDDSAAVLRHENHSRALSIQERQLRNQLLAEEVHASRLRNIDMEISVFSSSLSKLMDQRELSADQQGQIIHWIGSRAHPIAELAENGKIEGVEDVEPNTE